MTLKHGFVTGQSQPEDSTGLSTILTIFTQSFPHLLISLATAAGPRNGSHFRPQLDGNIHIISRPVAGKLLFVYDEDLKRGCDYKKRFYQHLFQRSSMLKKTITMLKDSRGKEILKPFQNSLSKTILNLLVSSLEITHVWLITLSFVFFKCFSTKREPSAVKL